jgi:hypothetical protein
LQQEAAVRREAAAATREREPAPVVLDFLRGIVVDATSASLAGVQLAAVLPDGRVVEGRSAVDGSFELRPVGRGAVRLVARHGGFLDENLSVGAEDRDRLRLVLGREPVVRGRVVHAETGQPIQHFAVALLPLEDGKLSLVGSQPPGTIWTRSDDGSFSIASSIVGFHSLQVFTDIAPPHQTRLSLQADQGLDELVEIQPGARFRGVVRDADGRPVVGAQVVIQPLRLLPSVTAQTGTDGTFESPPLPLGAVGVEVLPVDAPMLRQGPLRLQAGGGVLDLQLPRGAALHGVVEPWVQGRLAEVVAVHVDGPIRRAAVDDATGRYTLEGLTPGRTWVYVERNEPNWRSRLSRRLFDAAGMASIELVAGENAEFHPRDLVPDMARIDGRVIGAVDPTVLVVRGFYETRPLPDSASGMYRATPLPDGSFTIDGLLPGRWRIQVEHRGDVLQWRAIDVAARAVLQETLSVGR